MVIIPIIKIILSLTMLAHTSYLDVRYREVDPKIWLIFGVLGGILTVIEIFTNKHMLITVIVNVVLGLVIGIISYVLGLFGGADFLCLFILSIIHPYPPIRPLYYIGPIYPFILTIVTNSLLLTLIVPVINFIRNMRNIKYLRHLKAPLKYKLLYPLIGYPVMIKKYLKMKYTYPLIIYKYHEGKTDIKFRLTFNIEEEHQEHQEYFKTLIDKGVLKEDNVIWVTQGIPLLVFITLGYIMSISLGDIIMYMLFTS